MKKKTRPAKVAKKQSEKNAPKNSDNGKTFLNVCLGVSAVGAMILSYLQVFM